MRILMVLIPDDNEQIEGRGAALRLERFVCPYYIFIDAGVEVVIASPHGGAPWIRGAVDVASSQPPMLRFRSDQSAHDAVHDTLALEEVHPEDFEGAFCIGVPGPIWLEGGEEPSARMIARFLSNGKPVAVIPSHIDLEPHGSHYGLVIVGEGEDSPARAARALLGAVTQAEPGHAR